MRGGGWGFLMGGGWVEGGVGCGNRCVGNGRRLLHYDFFLVCL